MSDNVASIKETVLTPLDHAKLKFVCAGYVYLYSVFLEYSLEKYLKSNTSEDLALELLELSEEFKKDLMTKAHSMILQFVDVEKVFHNVGQSTTIQEVNSLMKKFKKREHLLKRKIRAWIDRGLYREK